MGIKEEGELLAVPSLLQQPAGPIAALTFGSRDRQNLHSGQPSKGLPHTLLTWAELPGDANGQPIRVPCPGQKIGDCRNELKIAVCGDLHVDSFSHIITPTGRGREDMRRSG